MTWPATNVVTTNTDAGTDNPQLAREDILDLMTKFNQLIAAAKLPIGSLYFNGSAATNPNTLLGYGTWASFGAGRVPVSLDPANLLMDTVGELLGSADAVTVSHTHTFTGNAGTTDAENANHSHAVSDPGHLHNTTGNSTSGGITKMQIGSSSEAISVPTTSATTGISIGIESATHAHSFTSAGTNAATGVSGTNANYQPSIAVYIWIRTA